MRSNNSRDQRNVEALAHAKWQRISVPPTPKLWRTRRSNEPDQSWKDSPMPADLDLEFAETVEAVDFDWPESLAVERTQMGFKEMEVVFLRWCRFGSWLRPSLNGAKRAATR